MELQSFLPLIGVLVAIFIACVSGVWVLRKAMADMQVGLSDLRGDLSDLRGEMRGLNKRVDGLDNHMNKRMDGLDKRMDDFGAEIRGINEFLRRKPTTEDEKGKDS